MDESAWTTIFPVLVPRICVACKGLSSETLSAITEIRLRAGWPPLLVADGGDEWLANDAGIIEKPVSKDEIQQMLYLMSHHSLYAFSEQVKTGFLTISGGHRVGIAGQVVVKEKVVSALAAVSSLNIRISREVVGCADAVIPYLFNQYKELVNVLIISPPRCGKTTLLRDIARQLSRGVAAHCLPGKQVGLVDERSEIAACSEGVPTVDLGPRLDVLDGCPKALGMMMLIRSMAPDVIITDELGRAEDAEAVREAVHAGVAVITSAHGRSPAEVMERPYVGNLLKKHYFAIYMVLGNQPKIGSIQQIIAGDSGKMLFSAQGV